MPSAQRHFAWIYSAAGPVQLSIGCSDKIVDGILRPLVGNSNASQLPRRRRRLINGVGIFFNYVFGIALDDDVEM